MAIENPLDNQNQSKDRRGGKRPGSGRKPRTIRGIVKKLPKFSAELLLHEIKANQKLIELANCGEPATELQTVKFLWEQAYGKPKLPLEHSGLLKHEYVNLRNLSDEDLETVKQLVDSAGVRGGSVEREL